MKALYWIIFILLIIGGPTAFGFILVNLPINLVFGLAWGVILAIFYPKLWGKRYGDICGIGD